MLKSKFLYQILSALALAVFSQWPAPSARAAVPSLPTLNWQQRSDWVNVKTDVTPHAYGDGVHDDTAAIQAGLNILPQEGYGRKTLYLPAGTYRISKTLTLTQVNGAAIIGQGRTTRIVWNGPLNQPMYTSNGAAYALYIGIVWDGAHRAAIGINHQPRTLYEAMIRHQDEAFLNFRDSGIRVGYNEVIPDSEMTYRNCLFQNCTNGITFLSYNDLNNNFSGCEFQDNGTAINCQRGNIYARDCHFERSRTVDIFPGPSAQSLRRCTSVGSKQFIRVPNSGAGVEITVQDCHVDRWTGDQGAIVFGMFGPKTIFDCSFTHPPDAKAPIRLTNFSQMTQNLLVSNNSAPASAALVSLGDNSHVTELPAGARGPSLSDPKRSFLKSNEAVPSTIIDVKTGFGATGDGYHDDTAAITNALLAGKSRGRNAVVYFPAGNYVVTSTLPITGGNYSVEGSGWATILHWLGPHGGAVFGVQDPQAIAIKQMQFDVAHDVACIQQTSTGAASDITYERLWAGDGGFLTPGDTSGPNGHVAPSAGTRGLECIGLPSSARVSLDDFTGATHFTDCSRAVILGEFDQGVIRVDGAQYEKSGFLGMLGHNTAGNFCDVIVQDNQDFVGSDFYTEQTNSALYVSGDGALPGQPGHVTIQGSKVQTYDPTFVKIVNYEGRVAYIGSGLQQPQATSILQTGSRPVDILLLGDALLGGQPALTLDTGAHMTMQEDSVFADPIWAVVPNCLPGPDAGVLSLVLPGGQVPQAAYAPAVATLDDFRLLGAYDLAINYP